MSHVGILLQAIKLYLRHRYDPVFYGYSYVRFRLQYLLLTGCTLDHAWLVLNFWKLHQGALSHIWTLLVGLGNPAVLHFEILHFSVRGSCRGLPASIFGGAYVEHVQINYLDVATFVAYLLLPLGVSVRTPYWCLLWRTCRGV